VSAWLREAGISEKGEEMLREYIGESGGLEDISTLEDDDKLELGASRSTRRLLPNFRAASSVAWALLLGLLPTTRWLRCLAAHPISGMAVWLLINVLCGACASCTARDLSPFYRPDDASMLAAMGENMQADAIKAVQAAIAALKSSEGHTPI
jgi:hypothetical protein